MAMASAGTERLWAPLVILVAIGMSLWDGLRDYVEAIDNTNDRISALARVVEARTSQTFQAIDQLLLDTADELGADDTPGDEQFHRFLTARSRIRTEALSVTIVGADGVIRHSTVATLVGKNVGSRSYLSHFQNHPGDDGLYIGEPVQALLDRKVVFVAHGLRHADGALRAVVVSALSPDLLTSLLDSAIPAEDSGAVTLSNRDHRILARTPDVDGTAIGQSLAEAPLMKAHIAGGGRESLLVGIGNIDGIERLMSLRTIEPYGITVAVSVGKREVLLPVARGLAGGAAFLVAVTMVTILLLRLSRSRDRARVAAEQRVIRARDHYVQILEDFPALIRRTDLAGRCDYVNRTWLAFTGRPLSDEIGDGWASRVHPEDAPLPASGDSEYRLRHHDGSYHWIREIRSAFTDLDGNPVGTLSACLDVTDAKLVQQQLQRSNEELEQFAYVASHDLREPLRMISSYIGLIDRRLPEGAEPELHEFLAFARDGATRMDRLVLDLLQLSRIGRLSAPPSVVDANGAIATAQAQLRLMLDESRAVVSIGSLPRIQGSEDDLIRLFQNLIANGVKYAKPDQPPRITVTAERLGALWRFSVTDNGIGIDPQYSERVFRIFQRLHARDAHGGGSGIGLAICKKIVERHGGTIWVTSPGPGGGATFFFTLPAA